MECKIFEYELLIKEQHLDSYGHVNNAVYLELYEEARWDFITKEGYGYEKIHSTQKGPVVLEANVKFKREMKLRDKIVIKTLNQWIKGKVMGFSQHMINEQGKVCSEADFTVGFMDMKLRKLIEPTEEWLSACGMNK
jgi:thioesterase-3